MTADTAKSPGFTSGFDNGHIGLSWGGSIQCFVFNITFSGRLDPDWRAEQLGEKPSLPERPPKPEKEKKPESWKGGRRS